MYTKEQLKKFADEYKNGLSLSEVAIKYHTSPPTVRKALLYFGVKPRDPVAAVIKRNRKRNKHEQIILEAYANGETPSDISKRLGIGYFIVKNIIYRYSNRNGTITDIAKVRALMNAGWKAKDIAVEFNTTLDEAYKAMKIVLKQIQEERENDMAIDQLYGRIIAQNE